MSFSSPRPNEMKCPPLLLLLCFAIAGMLALEHQALSLTITNDQLVVASVAVDLFDLQIHSLSHCVVNLPSISPRSPSTITCPTLDVQFRVTLTEGDTLLAREEEGNLTVTQGLPASLLSITWTSPHHVVVTGMDLIELRTLAEEQGWQFEHQVMHWDDLWCTDWMVGYTHHVIGCWPSLVPHGTPLESESGHELQTRSLLPLRNGNCTIYDPNNAYEVVEDISCASGFDVTVQQLSVPNEFTITANQNVYIEATGGYASIQGNLTALSGSINVTSVTTVELQAGAARATSRILLTGAFVRLSGPTFHLKAPDVILTGLSQGVQLYQGLLEISGNLVVTGTDTNGQWGVQMDGVEFVGTPTMSVNGYHYGSGAGVLISGLDQYISSHSVHISGESASGPGVQTTCPVSFADASSLTITGRSTSGTGLSLESNFQVPGDTSCWLTGDGALGVSLADISLGPSGSNLHVNGSSLGGKHAIESLDRVWTIPTGCNANLYASSYLVMSQTGAGSLRLQSDVHKINMTSPAQGKVRLLNNAHLQGTGSFDLVQGQSTNATIEPIPTGSTTSMNISDLQLTVSVNMLIAIESANLYGVAFIDNMANAPSMLLALTSETTLANGTSITPLTFGDAASRKVSYNATPLTTGTLVQSETNTFNASLPNSPSPIAVVLDVLNGDGSIASSPSITPFPSVNPPSSISGSGSSTSSPSLSSSHTPTPSPTPSVTTTLSASSSSSVSVSSTKTPSISFSSTGTNSPSSSASQTLTPSISPSSSSSRTPTISPTGSDSASRSPSSSSSQTPTPSISPSSSSSQTPTGSPTGSDSSSRSSSSSSSRTPTPSISPSASSSASASHTTTRSPSASASRSLSSSVSPTPTSSLSLNASPSSSASSSVTTTPTPSTTGSNSASTSPSSSSSPTSTRSPSSSITQPSTLSASRTPSASPTTTASSSPSHTGSNSASNSLLPSSSASTSITGTPSSSPSESSTKSPSSSSSRIASSTSSPSASLSMRKSTPSASPTISSFQIPSLSSSVSLSRSGSPPPSRSASASSSSSRTSTPTASGTGSSTPSSTPPLTRTESSSDSGTRTPSPSASLSPSSSNTPPRSASVSSLLTPPSPAPVPSSSVSASLTRSGSDSASSSPTKSPSRSQTRSDSATATRTSSVSISTTPSESDSRTPSVTPTTSSSATLSSSQSSSASSSASGSRPMILLPPVAAISPDSARTIILASSSSTRVPSSSPTPRPSQQMGTDGNNQPTDDFTNLVNLEGGCLQASCDSGGGLVSVPEETSSNPVNIPIVKDDGTNVGSVAVPNNPTGDGQEYNVTVSWITNRLLQQSGGARPASTLLEVNLYDSKGRPVSKFSEALEICIQEDNANVDKDTCLGYWDTDKAKWICEDPCLDSQNNGKLWCGKTDHLTSFALLLGGNRGSDPCGDGEGYTVAWISLGFICAAVVIFVLATLAIEVKYRRRRSLKAAKVLTVEITD